jgi:L-ascorbate metabolism protein UlaG (beta-lactamase superfamily)
LPLAEVVRFRDIEIRPLETPHGDTEHYSYLVTWEGKRFYFTGDTDSLDRLLSVKELDVAFVTPWLLEQARERGKQIPARKVVVYHHRADEKVPLCPNCLVPRPGENFRLETKR